MMTSAPHEQVAESLNAQRQRLRIKWNAVAQALGISPQHLLRIRQGTAGISDDVAVAIDDFLDREPGSTKNIVSGAAGEAPEPTDAEIIAMDYDGLADHARTVNRKAGSQAAEDWMYHALAVRKKATHCNPTIPQSG